MKVSELEGALLDYWVYRALHGKHLADFTGGTVPYSSDWRWGGPIIDACKMDVRNWNKDGPDESIEATMWSNGVYIGQFGKTRLIAAMRCFVASEYGDTCPDHE